MNIEQRREIISMIAGAYPRFFEQKNELDSPRKRMEIWNERLKNWNYEMTLNNLNNHIDRSPYEPKVVDIKPHQKRLNFTWDVGMNELLGKG